MNAEICTCKNGGTPVHCSHLPLTSWLLHAGVHNSLQMKWSVTAST